MKPFIKNLFYFFFLYVIISIIISCIMPYHWGNPRFSTKIQFLEQNRNLKYNTLFFGSSRIYRQINPFIFDSTLNHSSITKIRSFNLGAPATFNPQSYYLLENFLESELSNNLKFCFIELTDVDLTSDNLMHQERTTYWQNYSDLLFVTKSIYLNEHIGRKAKLKSGLNYSISYLENLLHIGHFGSQILNANYYDVGYLGNNKDGYLSLDNDYLTTTNNNVKEHLHNRKQSIIKNPVIIEDRKNEVLDYYNNINDNYDKVHLDRILNLIQKTKEKEIQLIFILSPRNGSQPLINLSQKIPEDNFIDMCNPNKYNLLYSIENSFDVGHLNSKGASLYSKLLSLEFKKKVNTKTQVDN